MNNTLNDTLCRVAEEVLESLAFVLPAIEEEEPGPPEGSEMATASISFTGPFEGTLVLRASSELLPAISSNMLGMDFDDVPPHDVQCDAFKELLNVICGNLLPKVAGEEAVFDVGEAQFLADGVIPATVAGRPAAATARLHMEEGWVELALFAANGIVAGA